jgi:hypothetical protein
VQYQYKQEKQMRMSDKPVVKGDNKMYRVQYPVRSEVSLTMFCLFKILITSSIKKVTKAHPKTNIIFGKVGGSWWKTEYRIIVGGKTKRDVQDAVDMLQKILNRGKK